MNMSTPTYYWSHKNAKGLAPLIPRLQQLAENTQQLQVTAEQVQVYHLINDFGSVCQQESIPNGSSAYDDHLLMKFVEEYALQLLSISRKSNPDQWPTADTSLISNSHEIKVNLTLSGGGNLRMDWGEKGITMWSKRIAAIFEARFHTEHRLGSFHPLGGPIEPGKVARVFLELVLRLKSTYSHKCRLQSRNPDSGAESRRRARKHSRRKQLFTMRRTKASHYQLPAAASETIRILGVDGMSSEESEGEVGSKNRRYFVKVLPWRAPSLTLWLHQLDHLPAVSGQRYSSRIYPVRERIVSERFSRARTPPLSMPSTFYSQTWLTSQSPLTRVKLAVSEELLDLPSIPLPRIPGFEV